MLKKLSMFSLSRLVKIKKYLKYSTDKQYLLFSKHKQFTLSNTPPAAAKKTTPVFGTFGKRENRETLEKKNMTKIENQTAVTSAGETTKLPSGAIKKTS